MISIVLASRKRPLGLAHMLASLYETAANPSGIKVAVALDPDDDETLGCTDSNAELRVQLKAHPTSIHFWVAPKRYGYQQLHYYVNSLAAMTSVTADDWLMWFNDDMRMLTQGWDDVIRGHRPAILWPRANHVPHANIAPIWPGSWYNVMGRVSMTMHLDTYLQRIGEVLDRHDRVDIEILHDRADVTGNNDDETYHEGRALLGSEGMVPDFDEGDMISNVMNDAGLIYKAGLL